MAKIFNVVYSLDSDLAMSQNIDQQCNEYIDFHINRGYEEINFQELDRVISAHRGRAIETRLLCPSSYLANLSPYVFISPDYDEIRARVTRTSRPVVDSQEFTDLHGNVIYRVEIWDLSRNMDALELYRPDDFWIQRVIMKTNVAAGADYLYEFKMICAPTRAQDILRRRL